MADLTVNPSASQPAAIDNQNRAQQQQSANAAQTAASQNTGDAAGTTAADVDAQQKRDEAAATQAGTFVPTAVPTVPAGSSLALPSGVEPAGSAQGIPPEQLAALQAAVATAIIAITALTDMAATIQRSVGAGAGSGTTAGSASGGVGGTTAGTDTGSTRTTTGTGSRTRSRSRSGQSTSSSTARTRTASRGGGGGDAAQSSSATLGANKRRASQQLDALGATPSEKATILAIGMQESDNMNGRDASKDGSGGARNISRYNVNEDLIRQTIARSPQLQARYGGKDPSKLGDTAVLDVMLHAQRQRGQDGFLNFMRGGDTGFKDGHSYGAAEYRTKIQSVARSLLSDPLKMTDNSRYANKIGHV